MIFMKTFFQFYWLVECAIRAAISSSHAFSRSVGRVVRNCVKWRDGEPHCTHSWLSHVPLGVWTRSHSTYSLVVRLGFTVVFVLSGSSAPLVVVRCGSSSVVLVVSAPVVRSGPSVVEAAVVASGLICSFQGVSRIRKDWSKLASLRVQEMSRF